MASSAASDAFATALGRELCALIDERVSLALAQRAVAPRTALRLVPREGRDGGGGETQGEMQSGDGDSARRWATRADGWRHDLDKKRERSAALRQGITVSVWRAKQAACTMAVSGENPKNHNAQTNGSESRRVAASRGTSRGESRNESRPATRESRPRVRAGLNLISISSSDPYGSASSSTKKEEVNPRAGACAGPRDSRENRAKSATREKTVPSGQESQESQTPTPEAPPDARTDGPTWALVDLAASELTPEAHRPAPFAPPRSPEERTRGRRWARARMYDGFSYALSHAKALCPELDSAGRARLAIEAFTRATAAKTRWDDFALVARRMVEGALKARRRAAYERERPASGGASAPISDAEKKRCLALSRAKLGIG